MNKNNHSIQVGASVRAKAVWLSLAAAGIAMFVGGFLIKLQPLEIFVLISNTIILSFGCLAVVRFGIKYEDGNLTLNTMLRRVKVSFPDGLESFQYYKTPNDVSNFLFLLTTGKKVHVGLPKGNERKIAELYELLKTSGIPEIKLF